MPFASIALSTLSRRATDSARSLLPLALTESQEILERGGLQEGIEIRPRRAPGSDRCDFCGIKIERNGYTCAACSGIQLCTVCYDRSQSSESRPLGEEQALICDITGDEHDWKIYSVQLVYLLGILVFVVPAIQVILGIVAATRVDGLCSSSSSSGEEFALLLTYAILSLTLWLPVLYSPLVAIGLVTTWQAMFAPVLATVVFIAGPELTTRCSQSAIQFLESLSIAQYVTTGLVWIAVPLSCLNQRSV